MKVDNPEEAIEEFLGIPKLEPEKGDWYERSLSRSSRVSTSLILVRGFKGLKQAVKLEFKLKLYDKVGSTNLWLDIQLTILRQSNTTRNS